MKSFLGLVIFVSLLGLYSCMQSIETFQSKAAHLKQNGGHGGHGGGMGGHGGGMGGHGGGMGGHGGGMGGHGGGMGGHGGGMGGHGGGMGGHGGGMGSGHTGFRSKQIGSRMKDKSLGDFTEKDGYRSRSSSSRQASAVEQSADDAIALNSRMDPSAEDVQFLDTKNGRLFGKDSDIKEFIREQDNIRQAGSRGSVKMSPVRSAEDKCDLIVTNATFAQNRSCSCEHVTKSICVFADSEPRPTPGSKVMYEGCYKANMPGIIDPEYICQAVRYCEEKKCDAIYHDGSQFIYIKCYYGSLPVKKTTNSKAHIFTLSKSC